MTNWFPLNDFEFINLNKFYKIKYRIARVDNTFVGFILYGELESGREEVLGCVSSEIDDEMSKITRGTGSYTMSLDTIENKVREYLLEKKEITDRYDPDDIVEKVMDSSRYKTLD